MSIFVKAAAGLLVPMEGGPRRYINEHQPVEIEESAYYQRCLESGDLVRADAPKPVKGEK